LGWSERAWGIRGSVYSAQLTFEGDGRLRMTEANTSDTVPMGHPRQRLSLLQRSLLICALIWALVMIVPDTYRLFWPVGTLGFSADNDGIIFGIEDAPATQADIPGAPGRGLRAGDTIDLSRKPCFTPVIAECRSFLAVFGGMGGLVYVRSDTVVTLPVILGDAAASAPVSVSLKAQDHILDPTTKIFLLLILIAGVVVIWRSFTLVWDLPSRMTLGFFLYAIWFNPGPYYVFYAVLQRYPVALLIQEFLQSISQGAGYAGFLIFALRFPRNETEPRFQWVERLAVPIGVLLAALQLSSFLNVFGLRTEILTRCAILGGYIVGVAVLIITFQRRKLQPPLDYQRMRWILWGCLIGLPAFIFAVAMVALCLVAARVWGLEPARMASRGELPVERRPGDVRLRGDPQATRDQYRLSFAGFRGLHGRRRGLRRLRPCVRREDQRIPG
jgi:hypothetical protein